MIVPKDELHKRRIEQARKYLNLNILDGVGGIETTEIHMSPNIKVQINQFYRYVLVRKRDEDESMISQCKYYDDEHKAWFTMSEFRNRGLGFFVRTVYEAFFGIPEYEQARGYNYIQGILKRGYAPISQSIDPMKVSLVESCQPELEYPELIYLTLNRDKAMSWEPKSYEIDWDSLT